MKMSSAFPSDFLKAADLQGQNVKVIMGEVQMKEIGDDKKPVLYFQGKNKGLVLNKTNSKKIVEAYGDDTDGWAGRELILFEAMVDFKGDTVAAIRVRVPQVKDQPSGPVRNAASRAELDDEIPF